MPGDKGEVDATEAQQDWRLIHQLSTQDVAFFKSQQWFVTNYGLLLYAALVDCTVEYGTRTVYDEA